MANLIAVQLETSHDNADGTAWYAYFDEEIEEVSACDFVAYREALEAAAKADGAPLGLEFDHPAEEAPNALSRHTGLRRYRVAGAV